MDKIRGVNLGNWLVLEKWMSPELYSDTTAEDETYLCLQLSEGEKRSRLKVHRDHYITSRDFAYIAEKGFNAVRLPVPFFVFEDYGPYVHCVEYVDKAMKWAGDYHLKVLLDLHTVPGSQNGSDNAGICGIVQWAQYPERVEIALDVLERLALRYGQNPALLGIEVLNEPQKPPGRTRAIQKPGWSSFISMPTRASANICLSIKPSYLTMPSISTILRTGSRRRILKM